jgi:signal transduction histidine kinase
MSVARRPRVDHPWPRDRRALALDVALALVATAAELGQLIGDSGTPTAAVIVLAAIGGGVLVFRRRAPMVVLATTLATTGTVALVEGDGTGVAVLIALYTVAAICELRTSLAALVPTAAVVAGLSAATAGTQGRDTSALGGAVIATVLTVGIWGLGAYRQTRRRYLLELEERAAAAERERDQLARIAVHEERASIARELHDIVAHSVAVMLVGVRGARDVLRASPDIADDTLAGVERSGEQSLSELRRILSLLRDPERRAESRPQPCLAELDELVAEYRQAGLPVQLEVAGEPEPLPGGVELSAYRIVEEALTNALKHSAPTRVDVTLSYRGSLIELEVVDDGTAAASEAAGAGQGIVGLQERVALLGGELETGRRAGGGFRVAARLPVVVDS